MRSRKSYSVKCCEVHVRRVCIRSLREASRSHELAPALRIRPSVGGTSALVCGAVTALS